MVYFDLNKMEMISLGSIQNQETRYLRKESSFDVLMFCRSQFKNQQQFLEKKFGRKLTSKEVWDSMVGSVSLRRKVFFEKISASIQTINKSFINYFFNNLDSISVNNWFYVIAGEVDEVYDLLMQAWNQKFEVKKSKKGNKNAGVNFGKTHYQKIQILVKSEKIQMLKWIINQKIRINAAQFEKHIEGVIPVQRLLSYIKTVFKENELALIPETKINDLLIRFGTFLSPHNVVVKANGQPRTKYSMGKKDKE